MDSFDSITNQMLLMEKYELAFGIQTNDINASPISLVTMKEATDCYSNSLLEKTISHILQSKACELTNLSLTQLLALPTYQLQMVFRSINKINSAKVPGLAKIQKELERANKP